MSSLSASQLVECLKGISLKNRTGILLLSLSWLGRESDIASHMGISFADERQWVLGQLKLGQRYLGQTWMGLITKDLDGMIRDSKLDGHCLLVANLDIILSSVGTANRSLFWSFIHKSYKPPCGVLLTLPSETRRIITDEELSVWAGTGRLAIWEEGALKL